MIQIKSAVPADLPEIQALWHSGFGDSPAFVDSFYRHCCKLEDTLLLREDGPLLSMAAVPPVTLRLPDGGEAHGAYLYALTTAVEARGQGLASILLKYADFRLVQRQLDFVSLVPALPSLFPFFQSAGYRPAFSLWEGEFSPGQLPPPPEGTSLRPADPAGYGAVREALLAQCPHIAYSTDLLTLQHIMCQDSGGMLSLLELPHGPGCASVERTDGGVLVKELLAAPADLDAALALIAQTQPSPRLRVRSPACSTGATEDGVRPFGLIKWYSRELEQRWGETQGYLGLAFD